MKTVSGKVVSCQHISLSRAAKYISRFTASDNEASPAFAAYLRRTSAAFNELVQLHKEYKIVPLGESKLKKKDISSGIVARGTANSVVKAKGKKGDEVNVDEHSRNVHSASVGLGSEVQNDGDDVVIVSEVKNEIGGLGASEEVKNDVPDVGGTRKKSKKKRGNDVDVPSIENDHSHDTINPNEADNEMGSLDASEDLKKKKKKKNKVEVEVIGEKKTHCEAEGRENGHNMETEAAGKKESRKRKHERLADEELVGSPEAVRSKKKKYKQ